jgi:hypothetical protein
MEDPMATMNIFTGTFESSNDRAMSYVVLFYSRSQPFHIPFCQSWSKIVSNIFTKTLHFWSWWLSLTNSDVSNKWPLCPPCDIINFRAHNANTSVPMSVVIWLANIMDKWNSSHTVHTVTTTIVLLIHVMHVWGSYLLIVTIYVKYMGVAAASIFWTCGRLVWVLVDVYTICNKTEWL